MTVRHFPPFLENLSEWQEDIFLLFVKTCQNDIRTFSFFFWKLVRMTVGHFPPFFENLSEWQWDIFLLFWKTCQNEGRTFSSFLWKNVRSLYWQVFIKRRKTSHSHSDKICKKGGKWPTVILTNFGKKVENVLLPSDKISQKGGKYPTVIFTRFHKNEENVPLSLWQVLEKRRKMSYCHSDKFS